MSVILFEPALARYFNTPDGPLGQFMRRRGEEVRERALNNASGPIIGIDSGDLTGNTFARVDADPRGARAVVGSTAEHRGVAYPAFVHRAGAEPGGWLKQALRDEFPNARLV